jgi:4-amino-4-deoxy-L-arabinose transferase-like glycosyltransferase
MRRVHLIAAGVLALFAALVWSAGARKCETIDEGLFIGGGVAQVHDDNPNIDLSHPPLLRWLAGASATLVTGLRLPPDPPFVPTGALDLNSDKLQQTFNWARDLLYLPGNNHDRVLFWGRFPFALLGALAGWVLFVEARRRFGDAIALVTLGLFCFTPEVLAHAEWAHSDLASALTLFLLTLALAQVLERTERRCDVLLGGALALAVLAKLTAVLLVPFVAVLVLSLAPAPVARSRFAHAWLRLGIAAAVVFILLLVGYAPRPRVLQPHEFLATDIGLVLHAAPQSAATRAAMGVLRHLPLPDTFLKGLVYTSLLGKHGQIAFFHGQAGTHGWWYYFPAAVFLKYPTPLLLLALPGFFLIARNRALSLGRRLAFTLTPLWLLVFAMGQSINIGVRSVLFLAPFLALWAGAALTSARTRSTQGLAAVLAALSIISGMASWPNFLAYFNPLLGGTRAADRWLVDSNLDWGQDLPELARTLHRRGIAEVRLAYFGGAQPRHWGIHSLDPLTIAPGWYAISRTFLAGLWPASRPYAWLNRLQPTELVGGSIALIRVSPQAAESALRTASEVQLMNAALDARFRRHDLETAIRLLRSLLARNPRHYGARYQLAAALDAAGNAAEALAAWRAYLPTAELAGDNASTQHARARIDALSGRTPRPR